MTTELETAILRGDGYKAQANAQFKRADKAEATIAMLREALAESNRRTTEARVTASDEEPWVWSDDDDIIETVEGFGHMMVVRITGGHLRALIAGAVESAELRRDAAIGCARDYLADLKRVKRELLMEREGLGPEDMEDDR